MNRNESATFCRNELNKYGLNNWHVRIAVDNKNAWLGKCSYKDKTIFLNSHHLDQSGELEVKDTIWHEIAHALTQYHDHDLLWKEQAIKLGCTNPTPCATYALNAAAIDAIRSGDLVEVTYEERTIREPKHQITRYQDKCDVCHKIAKEKLSKEFRSKGTLYKKITLECGHIRIIKHDSQSAFDLIVSNGWMPHVANCNHEWDKTTCMKCNEHRLFQFQIEGARFIERQNGKAAVFDEMGLGKTVQSLAYLKYHPEMFPALFVVKSGIKYQWMKEIIRWLGEKYFPQVISSGKDGVMPGLKCYITSYDLLRRFDLSKIKSLNIQTVILDEVQAIKNPDATRTQEVRKICKEIPGIIPLSGTPWKNRGSEFFVVLNMLDPVKFWSYQSFLNTWVDSYWDGNKMKEGGIRDIKRFKEHIKDLAIRRERAEVMPELPLINRVKLHVKMEDVAQKSYDNEVSDFVKFWNNLVISGDEDSASAQMEAIARLQRMRHILGLAKIPATMEFIEEFLEETDRKLIVGVHHKDVGELLYRQSTELAKEYGTKVLKLTGEMSSMERFETQEEFNKLPRCILIASTLASGEGLNLQTASDIVVHERQWNPMNEEQLEGRCIRIGQLAQSVTATYVHADSDTSTDIHLDKIVEMKRRQYHAAMNKGEQVQWNEQSLIKDLIKSLVTGYSSKRN